MSQPKDSIVSYREDGPITIGTVGRSTMLEGSLVTQFGDQVLASLSGRGPVHLLLDFSNVGYLSSAALSELIKISDAVVASGGAMRVCGLSADIFKVFQITRFDKAFDIHRGETVDRAVVRFKRAIEIGEEEDAWETRPGG